MSDAAPVTIERVGDHVVVVTLDRPHARNAVDGALAVALEAAVDAIEADDALWVAILAGAGDRAFCAGADLKAVSAGRVAELSTARGGFAGFVHRPRRKVWIAAVHGAVLAGGLELMLACDFAIAADDAWFGLPEVRRGLVATEGGLYRLPRRVPHGLALEMVATGAPIDAARALQAGLVNRVVPADALHPSARQIAAAICDNAPLAVFESMAIARDALGQSETELKARSRDVLARLRDTHDFVEGATAFVEKRKPVWTGR